MNPRAVFAEGNIVDIEEKLKNVMECIFEYMPPLLNERQIRVLAACVAMGYGYGGISEVHRVSGIARSTIYAGMDEMEEKKESASVDRTRKEGAGRSFVEENDPSIPDIISKIIEGSTYGNPEQILCYTTLSLRKIASILKEKYGLSVSHVTVGAIMETLGYSKQKNQKLLQVGKPHPDRNAQFEHINEKAKEFLSAGEPVISVDTKKKENIGNFKNPGEEYRRKKCPRKVLDHDFPIEELGKVAPYGVYTLNNNTGFINLGTSHDTGKFAVESIRRWWMTIGRNTFPNATRIYINCDGGGSNGVRSRQWKFELAQFAMETGLEIHVSHLPPGASKWNKIEHRLFCYISRNWQGKPLIDIPTTVDLIGSTTTTTGLKVICQVDDNYYEKSVEIPDDDFERILIEHVGPNDSWNYIITGIDV